MAWTQADVDKLDAAIASGGVLSSLTIDGQTFTFRSLDDMLKLRAVMQQALGNAKNYRVARTSKGL